MVRSRILLTLAAVAVVAATSASAQKPAPAAGASRIDRRPGGLVELERDDHAREHDEVADEQNGKTSVGHDVLAFAKPEW